jgi:hypothetical protein
LKQIYLEEIAMQLHWKYVALAGLMSAATALFAAQPAQATAPQITNGTLGRVVPLYPGDSSAGSPNAVKRFGGAFAITNGADEIVFTDQNGNSLNQSNSAYCVMSPATDPKDFRPPCDLKMRFSSNGTVFHFTGKIADQVQPGTYYFYVRAHNAAGWSNIGNYSALITAKK